MSTQEVKCPICQQIVEDKDINTHLDNNCVSNTRSKAESPNKILSMNNNKSKQPQNTRLAPLFSVKKSPHTSPRRPEVTSVINREPQTSKRAIEGPAETNTKKKKMDSVSESMPLAAKVRPVSLKDFVGQEDLLGDKGILKSLIANDRIPSMVLWGPPGCGKTTIARIISKMTKSRFVELSATSHGTSDVKKAFDEARGHLSLTGQKTIVFIDEIHRFTKPQQDLFLPYVEQGTIHLIGATTENPSFKVNSALLSRCRVFVLNRLNEEHIETILTRAIHEWRGVDIGSSKDEKEAVHQLSVYSDGDARSALNTLEIALNLLPSKDAPLQLETIKGAFQKSHLLYDRNGDQHYDIISALHKSIRGSDPNASLYWLGRMLEAGEDPLYIARRLVRCASEDIGLADINALTLAMSTYHACERIGMPECDTILAELVVYLAETKKSVRSYKAYKRVKALIRDEPAYPVPLHIRNAPTTLMKNLGYSKGYQYNPDYDEPVEQTYMPEEIKDRKFLDEHT
ncbi:DNA polymerase III, clamp loader complex, gamma/delta/delta subunit [Pilobolus umbonatus]|nr:DNA polymerase III, clamp loader complex, gamma/delta/delta subunit [Pilobolus umbonatus]